MANFQDSRFFGMSPRAVLAGVIAVAVVVGLFFIPETVKFLFDAKPRQNKERVAVNAEKKVAKPTTTDVDRAALTPRWLERRLTAARQIQSKLKSLRMARTPIEVRVCSLAGILG
jgi:hypothetical protein